MADYILTPNMGLTEPIVSQTTGTAYATYINQSLTLIDRHDHTPGNGVQITPAGLNINSTVDFKNNSAINLTSTNFVLQSIDPVLAQTLYVKDGSETIPLPDLWYYDGNTHIQITSNGQTATTLANLPGESYSSGTFTWRQGTGSTTPAQFDIGSIVIRPTTAGAATGVSLVAPSAANYQLTFPTALPGSTSLMALDASGNISAPFSITGGLNASVLTAGSITQTQMGTLSVGTPQLIAASVTRPKLEALGQLTASQAGSFNVPSTNTVVPNLTATITTTGRPVMIQFQPIPTISGAIQVVSGTVAVIIQRGASAISLQFFGSSTGGTNYAISPSAVRFMDIVGAGTYTYTVVVRYDTVSSGSASLDNVQMIVYEM